MATKTTAKANTAEAIKQLHYLASALKAPRITEAAERLADGEAFTNPEGAPVLPLYLRRPDAQVPAGYKAVLRA